MMRIAQLLLLAAAATAIPLPASHGVSLLGFKPLQSDVAAGREVLIDISLLASKPTTATAWITVSSNASSDLPDSTTSIDLCHYAAACPLSTGSHVIRVPAILPRASAPGSYSLSVSLVAPAQSSNDFAPSVVVRVHKTLRVEGCPPCGTVLAYTRNGTPVYSNGDDQGTGNSCNGWSTWGLQYQCVELVQRYYQEMYPVDYAAQMCDKHPSNMYTVASPQPGDVYVTAYGTYGHTALVHDVNGAYVVVYEQNGSCSGTASYSIAGAECFLRST